MTPSLGLVVGLPVALVVIVAALIGAWWFRGRLRAVRDDFDRTDALLGLVGCSIVAVVLVVITAVAMFPYSGEYHTWRPTSGTVAEISSRLHAADSGMNQRFVVTFTDGRQRACDDTRCSSIKPGDEITLSCKRAYQWTGSPGWDCAYSGRSS